MKHIISFFALTLSLGAFAQERVVLNSKTVSVNGSSAVLVRTADTPDKVEVTFQVPMTNSYCEMPMVETVPRMCQRTESYPVTRRVCRIETVPTNTTPSNAPRGPRYNPPTTTREVCTNQTTYQSRVVRYDCSYTRSWCARYASNTTTQPDEVKIRFKNLPSLGGTEEETFLISARQRNTDGENVIYDVTPSNQNLEVVKKGILGFDSYVIQSK